MCKKIVVFLIIFFFSLNIFAELICPNCGESNPDNSKFCGFCGTPIDSSNQKIIINLPKELMEYSRKQEFVINKENKISLVIGLITTLVGSGMAIYGFSNEEITNTVLNYSKEVISLNNKKIDNYYYPEGKIEIKNSGNNNLKNFFVSVKFYDSSNNLIKTEFYSFGITLKPDKGVDVQIETDTNKIAVNSTKVNIMDYQYDKIYKFKDENLGWAGVAVGFFGVYSLLRYYTQTVSAERYMSLYDKKFFSIVFTPEGLYTKFSLKI